MAVYYYHTEQFLTVDIQTAWDFFSSAKNLAVITPPELDFNILTQLDGMEIYEGMLIDYTVKPLFGIRLRWQTEIYKVKRPVSFTDRQLKGPYKTWEHTHTFIQKENGILMKDEVKYQLPFGIIGQLTNALIVRKKIKNIFSFRKYTLHKIFNENGNHTY
jgi:ligand-binding SRPBCC domain-containing protein